MRKKLVMILLLINFVLCGYTFDNNSPNIKVNCNFGNDFIIYFGVDKVPYLSIDGNQIINISSSNIYGYCSDGDRITFPPYDQPYRSNYQQSTFLNITEILENNLSTNQLSSITNNYPIYLIGIGGGVLLLLLIISLRK